MDLLKLYTNKLIFDKNTKIVIHVVKVDMSVRIKIVGMRSSRHGLYKLGYTRVTRIVTKRRKNVNWSRSLKNNHSSDCRLQLAYMKSESLVIVDQHATVNILGLCTHRPSRQGSEIGLKCFP